MLSAEKNKLLTQVGPGTPMGEYLRRYWQPIGGASELDDNPIKAIRLLGEDLVLYKDQGGRFGLIDRHCPHRRADLSYGYVEEIGIRCNYHGWLMDEAGRCIEQPYDDTVNPNSRAKERCTTKAYPVKECAGLLFAYMGPPQRKPLLPKWDLLVRNDGQKKVDVCETLCCNWLQAMENSVDPTHTYFLHSHTLKVKGDPDHVPFHYRKVSKIDFELVVNPNWAGIQKQRIFDDKDAPPETPHPLIFPNILFVPVRIGYAMHFRTPIDDHNTQVFQYRFSPANDGPSAAQSDEVAIEYVTTKNEVGEFHLDSFSSQDHMAWETQGPLADRSMEHLGEGDRGVIMLRKLLREQIEAVQCSGDPIGVSFDAANDEIINLIPKGQSYDAFSFAAARQKAMENG